MPPAAITFEAVQRLHGVQGSGYGVLADGTLKPEPRTLASRLLALRAPPLGDFGAHERESVAGEASETLLRETVEELIAEAFSGHAQRKA